MLNVSLIYQLAHSARKVCTSLRVTVLPYLNRSCPGAVLLLPLLELHLSRLCQALDLLRSTSASSSGSNSTAATSLPAGRAAPVAGLGRLEETGLTGFSVEDTGMAALRLLYLVLAHSDEVMTQYRHKNYQPDSTSQGFIPIYRHSINYNTLTLCSFFFFF